MTPLDRWKSSLHLRDHHASIDHTTELHVLATVSTDIYKALLDLHADIRRALEEEDDLFGVRWLWDEVAWRFGTYDDGDRDDYLDPQSNIAFTPIWKDTYAFEFLDKQPLSRLQAERVNRVLNRFGLEIVASLVSKDQLVVYLGAPSDSFPSSMRDQYLGDIRVWRNFHGWMRFPRLDTCAGLNAAFTIAYRFTDNREEEWTTRFNQFKGHDPQAVEHAKGLMASAMTDLINRLALDPSHTVIVPCLASSEANSSPTGILPSIARGCSEKAHVRLVNSAISKRKHTALASLRSARERQQVIADAEYASGRIDAHNVLLLDDFVTRGDTMSAVASAIRQANTNVNSVYGVAFGKNERLRFLRERYELVASNDHVPDSWATQWPLEA